VSPLENIPQIRKISSYLSFHELSSSFHTDYSFSEQMSSSSGAKLIDLLNNTSTQLNRYFALLIFLFGVVGNILNTLVLSQRPLRSNPCAWLFLVASIAYLISILAGLTPRFLSTWNADMTNTNTVLCKIRMFIYFDSFTVASWLIMLATVERWLSSSHDANRRQRSTLKNARRGMILILIISTVIETQQIYCFEANVINTPVQCYTKTVMCGLVSDTFFALVTILLPLLLMFIFGLMIISNVRQIQARLQPMNMTIDARVGPTATTVTIQRRNQQKETDRQLLMMLFVQVLLIIVFTLPLALSKLYTTITRNAPKSVLQKTIENFIFNIFILFLNIAAGMPFYIYTLSGGRVFRKVFFRLMGALRRKIVCQHG
jgi:hypothetical protein